MPKFDEMWDQLPAAGQVQWQNQSQGGQSQSQVQGVRDHYRNYAQWLARQPEDTMRKRREEAEMIFRRVGITFAVYGAKDEDGAGTERLIPFDLIPRIIPATEWAILEKGLVQRVNVLNRFLHDVYHEQDILKAGIIPAEQILGNAQFRKEMMGVYVPHRVYSHIAGVDIVRAANASCTASSIPRGLASNSLLSLTLACACCSVRLSSSLPWVKVLVVSLVSRTAWSMLTEAQPASTRVAAVRAVNLKIVFMVVSVTVWTVLRRNRAWCYRSASAIDWLPWRTRASHRCVRWRRWLLSS